MQMTREEELRILQKAQAGDMDAFETIVNANEKAGFNLALRQLGNREDAEDAAQEVFVKAYSALKSFRGESKLSVWLYRITSNVCVDMLRRRRDTVSLSLEAEEGAELDLPSDSFDPAVLVERSDLKVQLAQALKSLSDDYREILLLRAIGGLSFEEIAETLSLDIGTVKSRIFRARKKLAEILGNNSENTSSKDGKGGARA